MERVKAGFSLKFPITFKLSKHSSASRWDLCSHAHGLQKSHLLGGGVPHSPANETKTDALRGREEEATPTHASTRARSRVVLGVLLTTGGLFWSL